MAKDDVTATAGGLGVRLDAVRQRYVLDALTVSGVHRCSALIGVQNPATVLREIVFLWVDFNLPL